MSLIIMRKGRMQYSGEDWDELENRPEPNEVCVWPFERSVQGKVSVDYKDGSIALYIGSTFQNLAAYMQQLHEEQGWPKPHVFYTRLPRVPLMPPEPDAEVEEVGELPDADVEESQEEEPEPEPEPEPAPAPVVRRRRTKVEEPKDEPVPVARQRRRRSENPERIRRVRAG